ncbi:hypothetical protein [Helicobacter suis]|uniref:hypothetical protein n=1 Tax=Helicobacter suis TaxID=104628 RepID=UPI00159B658C|nr:hypothetical protein [Helicobacter suis]BCD50011.1 Membrane protein [Helicobacter suis]
MKLSYRNPVVKRMVSSLTKIWIFYIVLSMLAIYATAYALQKYTWLVARNVEILKVQSSIYNHETLRLKKDITNTMQTLQGVQDKSNYIVNIKESIKGVLEMIPDSITIQSITIDYSSLTLKGIVPSKQSFELTIQQRLDSIFENSHVEFYPLSNGWFSFVSINSSVLPFIAKKVN